MDKVARMESIIVVCLAALFAASLGEEFTFELPDNDRQCFYEEIDGGVDVTLDFQVWSNGNQFL